MGAGGRLLRSVLVFLRVASCLLLFFLTTTFTENFIFESRIVGSSLPIYFSSSFLMSDGGSLESAWIFCLQKKILNAAKPFDSAQDAQIAHFRSSGTPLTLKHFFPFHTVFGFKHE